MGQSVSALPGISDLDLLRKGEGIIHLDPEIAYGAFDSRVPEQKLYGTQVAGTTIDEGCFGSTVGMCPEQARIEAYPGYPGRYNSGVLTRRHSPVATPATGE